MTRSGVSNGGQTTHHLKHLNVDKIFSDSEDEIEKSLPQFPYQSQSQIEPMTQAPLDEEQTGVLRNNEEDSSAEEQQPEIQVGMDQLTSPKPSDDERNEVALFVNENGNSLSFCLLFTKRRGHFTTLIERNGGRITSSPDTPSVIVLAEPDFPIPGEVLKKLREDVSFYSTAFVEESVREGQLMPLPNYVYQPSVKSPRKGGRNKFTQEEDALLVKLVLNGRHPQDVQNLKGNAIYKAAAQKVNDVQFVCVLSF
jgi:hypothetical protein